MCATLRPSGSSRSYRYEGGELRLFEQATNWKRYVASRLRPFLSGRVLEVGAGIGGTTRVLSSLPHESWTCLEPDPRLAARLSEIGASVGEGQDLQVVGGTIASLGAEESFDTILYIDVLEHIEEDAEELARAADHLAPEGALVVLSPAHPWLFTPFDAAIGHHRRYTWRSLAALTPSGLRLATRHYLDSVGLLASLANRLLLRQAQPTLRQILTWDRLMVPASRYLDPLTGYRLGKSVLAVFRR